MVEVAAPGGASGRTSGRRTRGLRAFLANRRARRRDALAATPTLLPWTLLMLGVAVAASTSAAQRRAVAVLSDTAGDDTDPLPEIAPAWMRDSRRARRGWTFLNRVIDRMGRDNLSLVAAGVAFYFMLSIFPALGALVSIYGLVGDTHVVQAQVQQLTILLPFETAKLLNDALAALLAKPAASLNAGLLVSLGVAVWAARAGTSSLMSGLNVALERPERRSLVRQYAISIGLTFAAILFAVLVLTAVAVIPVVLDGLPIDAGLRSLFATVRWPILGACLVLALDVVYNVGPCLAPGRWRFFSVGTFLAAGLWVIGSGAFFLYVTRFGSYDTTYGSLGAVIVLLLWFWISALFVLLGATVDAVRGDMRKR